MERRADKGSHRRKPVVVAQRQLYVVRHSGVRNSRILRRRRTNGISRDWTLQNSWAKCARLAAGSPRAVDELNIRKPPTAVILRAER